MNSTDKNGQTALHYAVDSNNLGLCRLLAKHSADINAKDANGFAPIHVVWGLAHATLIQPMLTFLLENGANPDLEGKASA